MILIDGSPNERVSALDRGFAYGDGVFRTMRARGGRALHWERHYAKLRADCAVLGLACPSEYVLRAEVAQVAEDGCDHVVKIVVTRGTGGRGYAPPSGSAPLRVVASFPMPAYPSDRDARGVVLRWCRTRVSVQPALAGVKHLNRLDSVLARAEWSDDGIAEGLMLDGEGHVVEGTMSNVFILEGSQLSTPLLDVAGVAGVQRDRLMAQAGALGLSCIEERITPERLLAADQVCVVNSVIGLWWACGLDERRWSRLDVTAALIQRLAQEDHA